MSDPALTPYTGSREARAETFAGLGPAELRRRAVTAANERDPEALWALTEAFLYLHGAAGARVSKHTLKNYRKGVFDLLEHWQHVNLLRPARDAGVVWVRRLERRYKPATVQVKLSAARMLYRALRWAGATEAHPFAEVRVAKDRTPQWKKRGAYSDEELERLLAVAEGADALVVLLGAHAGLRISEITNLLWEDVSLEQGLLLVRSGKGGKRDSVVISPRLARALRDAPRTSAKVVPWGTDYTRERFRALCARAGVTYAGRGVHGLRHSAGTRLYAAVGDLGQVADHLRHADVNTTRGYAKRNTERIRSALEDW